MPPVAIVQARVGSTRLPGKVLLPLAGKPVLFHVVDRLRRVKALAEVVVATTDLPADDPIRSLCRDEGIRCFSGSENDVLDRYVQAARRFGADPVVRITSDCPLIDPAIVGRALDLFVSAHGELAYVGFDGSFPDGLDVEVVARVALETAWREAQLSSEREHVTPFIWKQPKRFPQDRIRNDTDLSDQRWTVDEPEDYALLQAIFEALYEPGRPFGMAEVLSFLNSNPGLRRINQGIGRNEGYAKSLREDHLKLETTS
jgi:spore coat polysaccharide biosynthesis protein SpsF